MVKQIVLLLLELRLAVVLLLLHEGILLGERASLCIELTGERIHRWKVLCLS
jgi:hypothetical protein